MKGRTRRSLKKSDHDTRGRRKKVNGSRKGKRRSRKSKKNQPKKLSPICRAHLKKVGVPLSKIREYDGHASAHIEGALIEGYMDPDSFVLFPDLPASARKVAKSSERRFREMLAKGEAISDEEIGHLKTETDVARRERERLRLIRKGKK
jgi:hypothetical protein